MVEVDVAIVMILIPSIDWAACSCMMVRVRTVPEFGTDTGHKASTTRPGILWVRAGHTMGVKGILWWVVVRAYYGSTL